MIGHEKAFVRGTGAFGDPVDPGVRGWYQDELTVGIERLLGPTLTVGLKGTYRTLRNALENRCDLDSSSPETGFSCCGLMNPGSSGDIASGNLPTCNGLDGDFVRVRHRPGPRDASCQPDLPGHRALRAQIGRHQPLAPGELRLLVPARQLRRRRQPGRLRATRPGPGSTPTSTIPRCSTTHTGFSPSIGLTASAWTATGLRPGASPRPSGVRRVGRAAQQAGLLERVSTARPSFSFRAARRAGCRRSGGPASRCPTRSRSGRRP